MLKRMLMLAALVLTISQFVFAESNVNKDAYVIYKSYFDKKSTGVYSKENVVFVIAETKIISKRLKRTHYEGRAMLLVKDLLKKYITKDLKLPEKNGMPSKGALKDKIIELINSGDYIDINISNIRGRILENRPDNNIYRYVYAVPADQLAKYKKDISAKVTDVGYFIGKVIEQAKKNEQYNKLITYYLELGLIEDAIYCQKQLIKNKYDITNYYIPKNPFNERQELRKVISHASKQESIDTDIIKGLPGNYEIITQIINSEYKDDPLASVVLYLTSLPDTPEDKYKYATENISKNINSIIANNKIISEYSSLLQSMRDDIDTSFFKQYDVLYYSFITCGHLEFDNSLSSETNKYFKEAEDLFSKGKNIEKIIKLLVKSLSKSPRHSKSWNYLGAALTAKNQFKEALIVHIQAYQIGNSDIEVMANMADSYHKLHFNLLAKKYAEHLNILNKDINNNFVNKVIRNINLEVPND